MFKIFDKILNKSNSYNYYKNQNFILKKQINKLEKQNKKKENNYSEIISKLEELSSIPVEFKRLEKDLDFIKIQNNLQRIRSLSKNSKISIVFLLHFKTSFYDSLIELMNESPHFNPTIVLFPMYSNNEPLFNEYQREEYYENYDYFKSKGFNVIKGFDEESGMLLDLDFELKPHVLFYATHWQQNYPKQYQINNISPDILLCYISYGFRIPDTPQILFNNLLHNKAWKVFCETKIHKELASKYSDTGSSNVIYTGYPKLDPLIDNTYKKSSKVWKYNDLPIKIIWAPHHSIHENLEENKYPFSTFQRNYNFFYDYASENSKIEWILKPHPILSHHSFKNLKNNEKHSFESFEDYYECWDNLKNVSIYLEGDYLNMFANSNAMITDSVSFLAEYLYVDKPGLLLTRSEQNFNDFGEIIVNGWYQIEGTDFEGINDFIQNVVIEGKDPLKKIRKKIYHKYLSTNGITASSSIYNYLKEELIYND